MFAFDVRKNMQ